MICNLEEILKYSYDNNSAIGAFNVGNMEMVMGAIKAAEEMKTPIIIQIGEARLKHSPLELIGPLMVSAAKNSKVKIAVHLDHGKTFETIKRALELGFTSVMIDMSHEKISINIEKTNKIKEIARKYNASVESEIGTIGGNEGDGTTNVGYTDVEEAVKFYKETSVDALAIGIGNVHGNYKGEPKLNFEILKQINSKISVPLVLHGGSGISDKDFRDMIDLGIKKINIATASFTSLVKEAKEYCKNDSINYFELNEAMVKGTYENVKRHIKIFNNKK